jgi:hypothetical protein
MLEYDTVSILAQQQAAVASGNAFLGRSIQNNADGPAGFVKVDASGKSLRFADNRGNNFFMSLGNIAATGTVSLLFLDFETGAAVSVQGRAGYASIQDVIVSQRHAVLRGGGSQQCYECRWGLSRQLLVLMAATPAGHVGCI